MPKSKSKSKPSSKPVESHAVRADGESGRLESEPIAASGTVRWLLWTAIVLLMLGVPWAVLAARGYAQLQLWPAAAVPFGLNRVLVVHVLAVAPLSLWCGWQLTRAFGRSRLLIAAGVGLGLFGALISGMVSDTIAETSVQNTFTANHFLRFLWIALLQVPWAVAAMAFVRRRFHFHGFYVVDGIICGMVALLPTLHVQQTIERESHLISDAITNQQYVDAVRRCRQVAALGNGQLLGRPAWQLAGALQEEVDRLAESVSQPLAADASRDDRLERAKQLFSLGRFDQVSAALGTLGQNDPAAILRLGLTAEVQGDWPKAAERYGQAIANLEQTGSLDDEQMRLLRIGFERRANNLRRMGKGRDAERELLAGLQRWPSARDAFLMQLGYHYEMAGRTNEAMVFFQDAAEANPKLKPIVDQQLAILQQQAQGCLLRPARGATR